MSVRFRPMPLLTACSLAGLAVLVALGLWQLGRAEEKAEAVERYEAVQAQGPVSLEAALCVEVPAAGRAVRLDAAPSTEPRLSVYGLDTSGAPGWRLFATLEAPGCASARLLLVETGFRPLDGEARSVDAGLILTEPLRPGPFTPPAQTDAAEVYAYDAAQVEDRLGLRAGSLSRDWWLARDRGGLPASLADVPPSRHVGYALTWFGLAVALIGVYAAFHVSRRRLTFT